MVSPPSGWSVSGIRTSGASAGWQQVNSSRNRSTSTGPVGSWGASWNSMEAAWCLASRWFSRRIRSIARWPAVVVRQPPGLAGTPDSGHFSSAATSASVRNWWDAWLEAIGGANRRTMRRGYEEADDGDESAPLDKSSASERNQNPRADG